jgi:hypothetical protein
VDQVQLGLGGLPGVDGGDRERPARRGGSYALERELQRRVEDLAQAVAGERGGLEHPDAAPAEALLDEGEGQAGPIALAHLHHEPDRRLPPGREQRGEPLEQADGWLEARRRIDDQDDGVGERQQRSSLALGARAGRGRQDLAPDRPVIQHGPPQLERVGARDGLEGARRDRVDLAGQGPHRPALARAGRAVEHDAYEQVSFVV